MNALTTISPVLLLVAGFVVCFFGYRLLRLTLALAGFGVGLVLGLALSGLIHGSSQVFSLVVGLICGILGAVLATLVYKFGVFLLGAGAGLVIASVVLAVAGWHNPTLVRIIAALACGILTLVLERSLVSILSAFAGAWGVIFGAFHLLGWYRGPRPSQPGYWAMLACWLVLGLAGSAVQLRTRGKQVKE